MNRGEMISRLGDLHALSARTDASEQRILTQSISRMDAIQKKLDALRPRVLISSLASAEYQALILERGKLNMVIARSKSHLAKS